MLENIEELKNSIKIGIIGGGDMGCLYAKTFINNNWKNVYICDLPEKFELLKTKLKDTEINVLENGHLISRLCDIIFYSVEAENLAKVVKLFGNSTKVGAIVAGQTSVKTIEIQAFENYLPKDVEIITCHSMHGPTVDPKGQPLALIPYRNSEKSLELMRALLSGFNSKLVELSYQKHDEITADTQAVTHLAFISMGTAWKNRGYFPWETRNYVGGIENVKVNIALRIFSNKWHVYAGLAIYNPSAKTQIQQYTKSVSDLFLLMITNNREELWNRVNAAKEYVFGEKFRQFKTNSELSNNLLLSDKVLDQFSLGNFPDSIRKPNSHLSLLAMVDCWHQCKINPYNNMICQTPLFRLWLGIVEFLFSDDHIMEETIETALNDTSIRPDDLCFVSCAQSWSECIGHGIMEFYEKKFEDTRNFFEPRLVEASKLSGDMIRTISNNIK